MASIHSAYKDDVHDVPMSVIIRPFMPELDEKKVESLMQTIQVNSYLHQGFPYTHTLHTLLS